MTERKITFPYKTAAYQWRRFTNLIPRHISINEQLFMLIEDFIARREAEAGRQEQP